MSKHAITIPDGVSRLFQAAGVVALAALVGAAVATAIPRYRVVETASAPAVQVQAPRVTPSPIELPSPAVMATADEDEIVAMPVEDRSISDSLPSASINVERHASKEK